MEATTDSRAGHGWHSDCCSRELSADIQLSSSLKLNCHSLCGLELLVDVVVLSLCQVVPFADSEKAYDAKVTGDGKTCSPV